MSAETPEGVVGKVRGTKIANDGSSKRGGWWRLINRGLNLLLWLNFCAMSGTGLLLAFRLPPGSRGGRGLSVFGMSRHEWGDVHTWLSYAFIALIAVHLIVHWRWLWQYAARKRPLPIIAGLLGGLVLMLAFLILPVEKKGGGEGRGQNREAREHSAAVIGEDAKRH